MIESEAYVGKPLRDVEDLVLLTLAMLWGFRPGTLMKINWDRHVTCTSEGLAFTEAFRKGYAASKTRLRRLGFPYSAFPALEGLVREYRTRKEPGAWQRSGQAASLGVECAMKAVARTFSLEWPEGLYVTSYSPRVSCASYLFALGCDETRIKAHMGWALTGRKWFDYLRDVEVNEAANKLYRHVFPRS